MPPGLDLPGGEIHEILAVVFIAADVKTYSNFLAFTEAVDEVAFVLHQLELQVLRIALGGGGDDEFTLGESAGKRLLRENDFNRAADLMHAASIRGWRPDVKSGSHKLRDFRKFCFRKCAAAHRMARLICS